MVASWDSGRTREFDAHTLAGLSLALGVPLVALLLPPEDDGHGFTYAFRPPGCKGDPLPMADLMESVVMTDTGSKTEVMEAYRQRLTVAVGRYLDDGWAAEVAGWLSGVDEAYLRAERLRTLAQALMEAAANTADEFTEMADAIDPDGRDGEEDGTEGAAP